MTTKAGRDIIPGDAIVFLGRAHRIARIVPYDGRLVADGTLTAGTRIAYDDGPPGSRPWGMTIIPDADIQISD